MHGFYLLGTPRGSTGVSRSSGSPGVDGQRRSTKGRTLRRSPLRARASFRRRRSHCISIDRPGIVVDAIISGLDAIESPAKNS